MKRVFRDYGLSIVLAGLFFVSLVLHGLTGWVDFASRQELHGQAATLFGSSGYVWEWLSTTFENWQSEFIQLFTMVVLAAFLIHRGSQQSKDSDEEIKMMLNRMERRLARIESRRSPGPSRSRKESS
jgi:DNA-binding transcriptional regulator GbsR (MarR family)